MSLHRDVRVYYHWRDGRFKNTTVNYAEERVKEEKGEEEKKWIIAEICQRRRSRKKF